MYELTDVTKTYRSRGRLVTALENVSLTIPDGEFLAVTGDTGGGKSTLLQMLGALDRPDSGRVMLDDTDLASASEAELTKIRANDIGIVFQSFNLIPTLTARENVEAGLVPTAMNAELRRDTALEMLQQVGLLERADHLPGELSGGQQQRVAIARALAKEPRVLLADEPTGNLDEHTRDEVMDLLEERWRHLGFTFVVVTHDSAVARRAQRMISMRTGRTKEARASGAGSATAPSAALAGA